MADKEKDSKADFFLPNDDAPYGSEVADIMKGYGNPKAEEDTVRVQDVLTEVLGEHPSLEDSIALLTELYNMQEGGAVPPAGMDAPAEEGAPMPIPEGVPPEAMGAG